jgi:hypothetical protein
MYVITLSKATKPYLGADFAAVDDGFSVWKAKNIANIPNDDPKV